MLCLLIVNIMSIQKKADLPTCLFIVIIKYCSFPFKLAKFVCSYMTMIYQINQAVQVCII